MDYPRLITQLKEFAPVFQGRVAGAAEFSATMAGEFRPEAFPAAYVIPLGEDAEPNDEMNSVYQLITERIGVVVELYNGLDRRGQASAESLSSIRASIFSAILNWRMGVDCQHANRGFESVGGAVLQTDRARMFYQWEFSFLTTIAQCDGWQEPYFPLLEILANSDPGQPQPPFGVTFPLQPEDTVLP